MHLAKICGGDYRTALGNKYLLTDGGCATHFDDLLANLAANPSAILVHAPPVWSDPFDEEIRVVAMRCRRPPRDVAVVTGSEGGDADPSPARDLQAGSANLREVGRRGERAHQMKVVGEDGPPGLRLVGSYHPGV